MSKLLVKPMLLIALGIVAALFLANFLPYQLSKISLLNGREIEFPLSLTFALIFAFTFKPILLLIGNILLIMKVKSGQNPSCPNCALPMVRRVAKKGKYVGQEFYGCCNYPSCAGKIHIG